MNYAAKLKKNYDILRNLRLFYYLCTRNFECKALVYVNLDYF